MRPWQRSTLMVAGHEFVVVEATLVNEPALGWSIFGTQANAARDMSFRMTMQATDAVAAYTTIDRLLRPSASGGAPDASGAWEE